jgi:hypothetical protein
MGGAQVGSWTMDLGNLNVLRKDRRKDFPLMHVEKVLASRQNHPSAKAVVSFILVLLSNLALLLFAGETPKANTPAKKDLYGVQIILLHN